MSFRIRARLTLPIWAALFTREDSPTRPPFARAEHGAAVPAATQTDFRAQSDSMDAGILRMMRDGHVPGLSYAVTAHGKIVRLGALGVASMELHAPVVRTTRFEIASMSKMFAATAMRMLLDDGKVDLDDPVAKYLSGLPDTMKAVKIRHLIGMSTGWPDDWDVIPWGDVLTTFDDSSTMAMFATLPVLSPLGREFHYSSPGYAMLGMIVEKITRQKYADFLRDRIFTKAGMTATAVLDARAIVPERAAGYLYDDGRLQRGYYVTPYMHARADVGILSTAEDMAKWMTALTAGRIVANPSRLFESFLDNDGLALGYAYGWETGVIHGMRAVSHTGGYRTGFSSLLVYFPEEDVSITVLTNLVSSPRREVAGLLASRYVPGYVRADPLHPQRDRDVAETGKVIAATRAVISSAKPDSLLQALTAGDATEFAGAFAGTDSIRFVLRQEISARNLAYRGRRLVRMISLAFYQKGRPTVLDYYIGTDGRVAYIGSF
jgi:D-alanyl-D-alanine carboxypeptidase